MSCSGIGPLARMNLISSTMLMPRERTMNGIRMCLSLLMIPVIATPLTELLMTESKTVFWLGSIGCYYEDGLC